MRATLLPLCLVPLLGLLPQEPAAEPASAQVASARHSAITPVDRLGEAWWKLRLEACNERLRQGNVDLIFLGDSITQGWEGAGLEVWKQFYGALEAVNLGFSGDRTQHVLWRLEHHPLEALAGRAEGQRPPRLVVLMIGTNNSNGDDNSADEIGDGIRAIVARLRSKLPGTKVLILGIFPRGAKPNAQREKNAAASARAAKLADDEAVFYLDIGPRFLQEDGTLSTEIMPDLLHLSPEGYRIWAEAIEPELKRLWSER